MRNIFFLFYSILIIMVSLCWLGCTTPSDFSAVLFQVDSSEVKKVSFHPYEGEETIQIFFENGQWFASNERVSVPVSDEKLASIFQKIQTIETDSILQAPAGIAFPRNNQGLIEIEKKGGENISIQTLTEGSGQPAYLRFPENGDVFLLSPGSQKLAQIPYLQIDDFRNTLFTNFNAEDVLKVTYEKGDSLIVSLQKDSLGDWVFGDALLINDQSMQSFLHELAHLNHSNFDDSFDPITDAREGSKSIIAVVLRGKIEPVEIQCFEYLDGDVPYILHSSQNKGSYFASGKGDVYAKSFGRLNLLTGFQ